MILIVFSVISQIKKNYNFLISVINKYTKYSAHGYYVYHIFSYIWIKYANHRLTDFFFIGFFFLKCKNNLWFIIITKMTNTSNKQLLSICCLFVLIAVGQSLSTQRQLSPM
jgi:hypothetical protein